MNYKRRGHLALLFVVLQLIVPVARKHRTEWPSGVLVAMECTSRLDLQSADLRVIEKESQVFFPEDMFVLWPGGGQEGGVYWEKAHAAAYTQDCPSTLTRPRLKVDAPYTCPHIVWTHEHVLKRECSRKKFLYNTQKHTVARQNTPKPCSDLLIASLLHDLPQ